MAGSVAISSVGYKQRSRFLCLAFALLSCATANAIDPLDRVTLTAIAGAGGNLRPGAMTPVQVILENAEVEHKGQLIVSFLTRNDETRVETSRALELAQGASKRLTLYLPVPPNVTKLWVGYQSTNGKSISEFSETVQIIPADQPVFGAIGRLPRGLPAPHIEAEDDSPFSQSTGTDVYSRLFITLDQVPSRHEGLQTFDVLFISPVLERPLTRPQVVALRDWVLRGGQLIIDTSRRADGYVMGLLPNLLPFIPQGIEQGHLSLFDSEAAYARGRVAHGDVLLQSDDIPLVVRWNYGMGAIVAFTIEMGDTAFVNWEGRDTFWRQLLGEVYWEEAKKKPTQPFSLGNVSGDYELATNLMGMVSAEPSSGIRLSLVLLLTFLYALAAGPGDYFLVKRLGRPKLTWITFPLIVVLFTGAAYFGAKNWLGGDWEIIHRQRTVIFPQADAAMRFDITGVFVPEADTYRISDERGVMLRHLGAIVNINDSITIDGDDQSITQRIPVWTRRTYISSETVVDAPLIDVQYSEEAGDEHITVENGSELTLWLTGAVLSPKLQLSFTRDAPIGPGETVEISIDAGRATPPVTGVGLVINPLSARQLAQKAVGQSSFGRELNYAHALRRGAYIVSFLAEGADCPIRVDGDRIAPAPTQLQNWKLDHPQVIEVLRYRSLEIQPEASEETF